MDWGLLFTHRLAGLAVGANFGHDVLRESELGGFLWAEDWATRLGRESQAALDVFLDPVVRAEG